MYIYMLWSNKYISEAANINKKIIIMIIILIPLDSSHWDESNGTKFIQFGPLGYEILIFL